MRTRTAVDIAVCVRGVFKKRAEDWLVGNESGMGNWERIFSFYLR